MTTLNGEGQDFPGCCLGTIKRQVEKLEVEIVHCSCGKLWELSDPVDEVRTVKLLSPPKFPPEVFERLHSMEEGIKTFTSNVSDEMDKMGNEVETLKGDYNALDGVVDGLRGDVSKLSDSLDDLISQVDELSPGDDLDELCPHAFFDPADGPGAENRCRAPQVPGRDTCIMSDRGYDDGCRLTGPDITKPAQIAAPLLCEMVEETEDGGVMRVVGEAPKDQTLFEAPIRGAMIAYEDAKLCRWMVAQELGEKELEESNERASALLMRAFAAHKATLLRKEELHTSTTKLLNKIRDEKTELQKQVDAFMQRLKEERESGNWTHAGGEKVLYKAEKWAKETIGKSETIWIYQYIRADREEIDMGPFLDEKSCAEAMKTHTDVGAMCQGPFEKPVGYELYKGKDGD